MNYELAKRGKSKIQRDYTLRDIYKYYASEHKNDEFSVDEKKYRDVILRFNKRAMNAILNESKELKLPYRLGSIRIRKCKMDIVNNRPKIDFGQSRKLGRTVYHLNMHSDGYYYKFYWNRTGCNAKNYRAFCFEPIRQNSRELSRIIKAKLNDYFL